MAVGLTEAEIRFQLAEEDDKAEEDGEETLHHVTPAAMIIDLLYLEDQQYVAAALVSCVESYTFL